MQPEIWKDIPGYEGRYQASTEGRIRSLDRYIEQTHGRTGTRYRCFHKGRIKKPTVDTSRGYTVVNLGRNDVHCVHELIAKTFLGERENEQEVLHLNGVRTDARLENLKYGSHSENVRSTLDYGGKMRTLTKKDVFEIRRLLSEGTPTKDIADKFDVTINMIRYIATRKCYWWLE